MAAGTALMLAGQIVHNYSVWRSVIMLNETSGLALRVEPLGSGLFLTSTVSAGWCCVMTHVSSHGPGPVSANTRFLHTLDREPVPVVPQAEDPLLLEMVLVTESSDRRDSVHSTSV